MAKKNGYTTEQIIQALQDAKGYVSKTASLLRCTPQTVYNYAKRYPTVQQAWDDIREERHDFVENALAKRINDGSDTAIIFYLKTQCKSRGYIEKSQIEQTLEVLGDIPVSFVDYRDGIDEAETGPGKDS